MPPAQLSSAHFPWIRAFSHAPLNGDGVTVLNWIPVFALESKVIHLPRFCPLFKFLPTKTDPGAVRKREMKLRRVKKKNPSLGNFLTYQRRLETEKSLLWMHKNFLIAIILVKTYTTNSFYSSLFVLSQINSRHFTHTHRNDRVFHVTFWEW